MTANRSLWSRCGVVVAAIAMGAGAGILSAGCDDAASVGSSSSSSVALAGGSGRSQPEHIERIVSAGGNVTEVLYELGLGESLVGVDTTSTFPKHTGSLPKIGYLRRLSAEGIVSLRPTLFIATEDAQPPSVLDQLRNAGMRVELVPDAPGLDAAYGRVLQIGAAVGRRERAEQLVRTMRADVEPVRAAIAKTERRPSVLFIYARGQGSAQVAGTKTAAEQMIELAGGKNAAQGFEGFRPLTAEAVVLAAPDYYLMPALGLESLDGIEGLLRQPGIAQTEAGKARRVIAIEDSVLLGFGPRVATALRELAVRLHPELTELAQPTPVSVGVSPR